MTFTRLLAAAALLALGTASSQAKTYNAVTQFSASNPSGAWSYGTGTTGSSFTPYSHYTANTSGQTGLDLWDISSANVPFLGINASGTTYVGVSHSNLVATGVILMHPGQSTDCILRWTAPSPGTYVFSGLYEILDAHPTGIAAKIYDNATDITVTAFNGKTGILTGPPAHLKKLKPGGKEKFTFTLTVVKGEIVSFGLNNDANYAYDSTGVTALIKQTAR